MNKILGKIKPLITDSRGNSSLTIKEIESVVKNLFIKKVVEPDDLRGEFYQIFKEPILLVCTNSYKE